MSSNRRQRRAVISRNTFYRVVPMETKSHAKGVDLQDQLGSIQIIDEQLKDCVVVTVPSTTSYEMAEEIANRIRGALDQNVVILSDNVQLCRVEGPLDKKELAEVFKGVDNDRAEQIAETLLDQALEKAKNEGVEIVEEESAEEDAAAGAEDA